MKKITKIFLLTIFLFTLGIFIANADSIIGDVTVTVDSGATLTITTSGDGSGVITSSPSGIDCGLTCSYSFTSGTSVTLIPAPISSNGSYFDGWSGDCNSSGIVSMNSDKTCIATFKKSSITLTGTSWAGWETNPRSVIWANDHILDSMTVYYGEPYMLSWASINATSCTIDGVSVSPVSSGNKNDYIANFSGIKTHKLICTGSSGSITKTLNVLVPPKPTSLTKTCSSDANKVTLNWSLPVSSGYDGGYIRNSFSFGNPPFQVDVMTGTTAVIDIVPDTVYKGVYVNARASNGAWGLGSDELPDFSCSVPNIIATTKSVDTSSASKTNTVTVYGNVQLFGGKKILSKGFTYNWNTYNDPDFYNFSTNIDSGSITNGDWSSNISGLYAGANYKVRAYAIGEDNKIIYGNVVSFSFKNLPDLVASNITPTTALAGVAIDLNSTITNTSTVSVPSKSFYNFFQISDGANGSGNITDIPNQSTMSLGFNASKISSVSYTFTNPGTYYARACADKSNSSDFGLITESNENNNCSDWVNVEIQSVTTPFGNLSATLSPATCEIARGASTCIFSGVNYYVLNTTTDSVITSDRPSFDTHVVSGITASVPIVKGKTKSVIPKYTDYTASYGTNNLYLYNNGNLLTSPLTVTAKCTGTDIPDSNGKCIVSVDPVFETPSVKNITPTSATVTNTIISLGNHTVIASGISYGLVIGKENTTTSGFSGMRIDRTLTGLSSNTPYKVYGYVVDSNNNTYYSPQGSFTTIDYGTTGTIIATPNLCNIEERNNDCSFANLVWNTINPVGTSYVMKNNTENIGTANNLTLTNQVISYGYTPYVLFSGNDDVLDDEFAIAQCSLGTQWDGQNCTIVCKTQNCTNPPDVPITCTSNQILDLTDNVCLSCPAGEVAVRAINECQPKKKCSVDQTRIAFDNSCTAIVTCPSNKKWDSCIGKCVKKTFSSVGLCGKSKNYSYTEN